MKLNTLLMITAIVAFIFGLGFILVPNVVTGLYGNTLEGTGAFIGRYLGSAFIGLAFLAWLSRNVNDAMSRKVVVTTFFVTAVLGLVVALYAKFGGPGNALLWLNVVIYLLLAVGFGYFRFVKAS